MKRTRSDSHILRIILGYVDLIKEGGSRAERTVYAREWGVTTEWILKNARQRSIKLPKMDGNLLAKKGIATVPNFYFGRIGGYNI